VFNLAAVRALPDDELDRFHVDERVSEIQRLPTN
jgi:hypothetical protein